jgi:ABC-type Fe3+-hydroxamate transport system substrate-binding protein
MKITDQMGNKMEFLTPPKRIVSLVPSQTELLYELGLEDSIIGQTVFCIHPEDKFKESTKVGGTKKLKMDKILELNPDLIIGNKEENLKEEIKELQKHFPVWMSDIVTLDDAISMIDSIGKIMRVESKTSTLIEEIRAGINKPEEFKSALYLIWEKPWMAVGSDNFIQEMMVQAGFSNVLENHVERYPEMSEGIIRSLNPEYILLSTEPFPFKEKHKEEMQDLFPNSKVILVDGEMFSWYGSRIPRALEYFKTLVGV